MPRDVPRNDDSMIDVPTRKQPTLLSAYLACWFGHKNDVTARVSVMVLSEVHRRFITPLIIKYVDEIVKGFTTSLSIVISFLASLGFLH
jgi:Nucleotide-sugar transporter